jgi:tetratricopeptide (TPR) repeat protein
MSEDKSYLSKPELFMLDLLAGYQWDRPLNLLNMGGDLNIGIRDYLMFDGFSYRFTPIKNKVGTTEPGKVDALALYQKMTDGTFKWDALGRKDYFVDYQNLYTFMGVLSQRQLYVTVANALMDAGEREKALEIMDRCQAAFPEENFPLESIPLGFVTNDYMVIQMVENYYLLGEKDKARELGLKLADALLDSSRFYLEFIDFASSNFESTHRCLMYLAETFRQYGDKELSDKILDSLDLLIRVATGDLRPEADVTADTVTVAE